MGSGLRHRQNPSFTAERIRRSIVAEPLLHIFNDLPVGVFYLEYLWQLVIGSCQEVLNVFLALGIFLLPPGKEIVRDFDAGRGLENLRDGFLTLEHQWIEGARKPGDGLIVTEHDGSSLRARLEPFPFGQRILA